MEDDELLSKAEELIASGDLHGAKQALDSVKEYSGRKYFVESKYFKNKGWFNEERKCLKKALKAEPENEDYKKAMDDLEQFRKSAEYKEARKQMGWKDILGEGWQGCWECCGYCVCEGLCSICEGIADGC